MPYDKKAVHFGGGNIGRGFVAEFLHEAGYEVVFVDVMDSIIEQLQKTKSYTVTEIGEDGEREFTIDNYRAINSKYELEKVVHEIATADVVTCAVGPNILKFVADPVAKAIEARTLDYPLAVIACENAINATTTWKGFIESKLSDATLENIDKKARYANSAIDRIVPQQDPNAGLDVKIEKFFEWCVEQKPFENGGKKPEIKGVHYVDDLEPYIERKLFTVNTSHATAAYYGHNRHIPYIHEVLQDKELHDVVRAAVKETANLIVTKHGISAQEQDDYVEKIVSRISNPTLKDNVERVGRAPLRSSLARSASSVPLLSWLRWARRLTLSSVASRWRTASRTSRATMSLPNSPRSSRAIPPRMSSTRSTASTVLTHSSPRSSRSSRRSRRIPSPSLLLCSSSKGNVRVRLNCVQAWFLSIMAHGAKRY